MTISEKKYCVCCAKQFVQYETREDDDKIINFRRRIFMGCGEWCCRVCARDLDEYGRFPEERHLPILDDE